MKYAYVVSKENRSVTMFDFTDKTVLDLIEFKDGKLDKGIIYTWGDPNVPPYPEYAGIKELTSPISEENTIIPSDLLLKEICKSLNDSRYNLWETSCDVCFEMLEAYSKDIDKISLEDLIEAMQ